MVVLCLALGVQTCRIANLQAQVALKTLPTGPGWTPPKSTPPKIEGVPRKAAVATVQGGVRYLPKPTEAKIPCDLNELTVDVQCRVEVATSGGRLQTWGSVAGFGQVRELPKRWAGELEVPPALRAVPGAVSEDLTEDTDPTESAPPEIHISIQPRPLRLEGRLGYVLPTDAIRVGGSWYFSRRIGLFADISVPVKGAGDPDAAAGVAIRF